LEAHNAVWIGIMMWLASIAYAQELEPSSLTMNNIQVPYQFTCAPDQSLGDVSGSDGITALDASIVLGIINGKYRIDRIRCADVDCDREITEQDSQLILQYSGGLITEFSCGERIYDASISIATLKDSYGVGEKIELTDPPEETSFNNKIAGNAIYEGIGPQRNVLYDADLFVEEKLKKEIEEGIIPETIDTSQLPKYVKGELIVKLEKDVSGKISGKVVATGISAIDELNRKYHVEKIENVFTAKKEGFIEGITRSVKQSIGIKVPSRELQKIYKLKIPEEIDVEQAAEEYSQSAQVEYAEPNYIYYTSFVPNDFRYNQQWAHQNTHAEEGWDIERGSSDVVIAIIDTGVDYTHEDLAANIWRNIDEIPDNGIDDDENGFIDDIRGYDFVETDAVSYCAEHPDDCETLEGEDYNVRDNDPMDFNSHGTHVAGIAAAVTNNNLGVAGVCHLCKIMPVRAGFSIFSSSYGVVGSLEYDDIAQAIHYAVDNRVKIISMSFGGPYSDTIKEAIDYAYNKGVVLIAASGNSNTNAISYPAGHENVIAVDATDINDNKADFSNYGYWTDVSAPGVDILSTVPPYTGYNSELKSNNVIIESDVFEYSGTTPDVGIAGEFVFVNFGSVDDVNVDLTEKIALVQKGGTNDTGEPLTFKEKVENAYRKGAAGAVIFNNEEGNFGGTLQEQANIPAVSISKADGENLVNQITSGIVSVNLKVSLGIIKYDSYSGTSMATPYVAGLAGLILSKQDYSQEEVRQILRHGVDSVNSYDYIGTGRVNVLKTLEFESVEFVAKIASPINGELVSYNIIDIMGTANGDRYSLYYGNGLYPTEWNEIASGTNVNNNLLGEWNAENINDGRYTIKLEVSKKGRAIEEFVSVIVSKGFQEGWPQTVSSNGLSDRPTQSPLVFFDIDNDNDKEVLVGANNGGIFAWHSNGQLVEGWPQFTKGIVRASPSVADINNDGKTEIVVGSYDHNMYVFHPDGSLLDGWPQSTEGAIRASASLEDLNKDGNMEIIAGSYDGKVYVWGSDGALAKNWPQATSEERIFASPAIGDIDNDNELEIVLVTEKLLANEGGSVYVFNYDGSLVKGWPKNIREGSYYDGGFRASPILADIDKDGNLEIITGKLGFDSSNQGVYVFNGDGSLVDGWPQKTVNSVAAVAVGDLNNDGYPEIIGGTWFANSYGWIYAWNKEGKLLDRWPQKTDVGEPNEPNSCPESIRYSSIVIGDVNNDNQPDIIASTYCSKVYAWDSNGERIEGWPRSTLFGEDVYPAEFPIIDDLDKDGDVEIGVTSESKVLIWDLDTPYNPSTMEWPMFQHDAQHTGNYHYIPQKITPRPQSKIVNNENEDLPGYLYIRIEKQVDDQWTIYRQVWQDRAATAHPRIIPAQGIFKLDSFFNEKNVAIDESGDYRIVAEFRGKYARIIRTTYGELKASWEFEVE